MLRDKYETDKFFETILEIAIEIEPLLINLDQLLDDEELYCLIRNDFSQRYEKTTQTGRNSTPVEVVLRMLAVKHLYNLSYEKTERQVKDSLALRWFCRVYFEAVPDDTTLIKWANQVQPESLKAFNHRLTSLATELKVTKGRKLRTDGTVVESNIQPPRDSQLLVDSVRVLGRTLSRAKEIVGQQSDLVKETFRNRIRSARNLGRQISQQMGKRTEKAKQAGRQAYKALIKTVQTTLEQVGQVAEVLKGQSSQQAQRLQETFETFIPRVQQVIDQATRRVMNGEKVPATDKIVSIFEPHTDIICRNKANKPVEYGHKVWLDEVDGGIVTDFRVLDGNPCDETQWQPALDHHLQQFGRPPDQASADRGVHSADNEHFAQKLGVKRIVLPKPGYKSQQRKHHEKSPWFKQGRRWHNGIEGRISVLKRKYGMDCCLYHGHDGFQRWVGWAVIANNCQIIASK
ncbi:MAG: ISNCY family transposase [Anaerolineae bacterium]|nr:ISNCY family transposase [Anaerolineae bacterium]